MRELLTKADVDELLNLPFALVFKHSTRCSISARAYAIVKQHAEESRDEPVFLVRVIENREVSLYLADKVGVAHQSPQLLVLRKGEAEEHASHFDITSSFLRKFTMKC